MYMRLAPLWTLSKTEKLTLMNFQVEVKPYVLDDQLCDECQGARCGGKFAPFFCANVTCLQVNKRSFLLASPSRSPRARYFLPNYKALRVALTALLTLLLVRSSVVTKPLNK